MKKISAAFDGLKFSEATLEYAVELAKMSKALISGIFLESFLYHGYKLHDLIGTSGISQVKMRHLLKKDEEIRIKSATHFEQVCSKAKISYKIHHDKSFAEIELLKESIYSDLIVISVDETLRHVQEESPTQFIKGLLVETQCPVLIVPKVYKPIEKVVVLYDGAPSTVFAIKMLNYLIPPLNDKETEIISVAQPGEESQKRDDTLIQEFIKIYYPKATYTGLRGEAEKEIIDYLKKMHRNSLIVCGAYQRSQVSRWFKKSMADSLMKEISMPLFIAHNK